MKHAFFYKLTLCFALLWISTCGQALSLELYLNAPYKVNPIAEDHITAHAAPSAAYGFDCTTYVESILAQHMQAKEKNKEQGSLQKNLQKIRYLNGEIGFFSRAHLMEYHWIPQATKLGIIKPYPLKNTKESTFKIHLQEWFLHNPFVKSKDALYTEQAYKQPQTVTASVSYVPIAHLTEQVIAQLPSFMVVFFLKEIPQNTWPGQKEQQTLITHMGILLHKKLYHASIRSKKVSEIDLISYVRSIPSYVGVSFYAIQ